MLVKKVQYTNAGESAVFTSHWEKERMERLSVKLSYENAARNRVKLSMSKIEVIEMLASKILAEPLPKRFFIIRPISIFDQKELPKETVAHNTVKIAIEKTANFYAS